MTNLQVTLVTQHQGLGCLFRRAHASQGWCEYSIIKFHLITLFFVLSTFSSLKQVTWCKKRSRAVNVHCAIRDRQLHQHMERAHRGGGCRVTNIPLQQFKRQQMTVWDHFWRNYRVRPGGKENGADKLHNSIAAPSLTRTPAPSFVCPPLIRAAWAITCSHFCKDAINSKAVAWN